MDKNQTGWGAKPLAFRVAEQVFCTDCYAHENDDSPFDLEGEPLAQLVGLPAEGCCRCARFALPAPAQGIQTRHGAECHLCGCTGEDAADFFTPAPPAGSVPARGRSTKKQRIIW